MNYITTKICQSVKKYSPKDSKYKETLQEILYHDKKNSKLFA